MKDYSAMSDDEISKEVGNHLGVEWANLDANYHKLCYWKAGVGPLVFDPCNNPSDAWPIIEDNKISINYWHNRGKWQADIDGKFATPQSQCASEKPLRAAMIVYLMMKDAEKGHG